MVSLVTVCLLAHHLSQPDASLSPQPAHLHTRHLLRNRSSFCCLVDRASFRLESTRNKQTEYIPSISDKTGRGQAMPLSDQINQISKTEARLGWPSIYRTVLW